MFLKTAVLKNLREFPGNHARWSAFNSKNQNNTFRNFLKLSSYSNISGWLLLWIVKCPKDISVHCFISESSTHSKG